jgi:hypothetical protein
MICKGRMGNFQFSIKNSPYAVARLLPGDEHLEALRAKQVLKASWFSKNKYGLLKTSSLHFPGWKPPLPHLGEPEGASSPGKSRATA